jgi:class 3 adenylate cyclase/tetratricopeptide (TPR) repeat protein
MPPAEERKIVTVLFADLAGSTALAVGHDPEQFRALLTAFFEEMAQQIRAFGGVVEKYAGDAIMAVFGVPQVHEDDAERATRAAVAMRESLAQLNPMFREEYGAALELRVGIATGEAVAVTEVTRELMVTGEVANLAARLQSVAPGIVVSDATHRLVRAAVVSEPLPPLSLKGFPAPVPAHVVTALRAAADGRGVDGLSSPVIGRDRELAAVRRCAEDLARGRGQIVSITGEAGIGKSRLKNELRDGVPAGVRWLEGRCKAFAQTSYDPIVQILRSVFQLNGTEPPGVAGAKLRVTLRSLAGTQDPQVHAAVASLLGLSAVAGGGAVVPPDPRALEPQLLLAVRAIVEALTARGPLILAVEDLHWADRATIETLIVLTELTDSRPLMLLVTSRPDHDGGSWDFRFHAQRQFAHRLTELMLAPLAAEESERLVEHLLQVAELPPAIRGRILEQSEGNPFFVEEIIRTLIEEDALRREGERWVAADVSRVAIPATLRGLIAARIDRLPTAAKAVLQRAAVIGRVVGYRPLQALHDGDVALDRSLADLLRAELLREWAHAPEREYLFKHALTLDAAYASMLLEQRRALHRRLAVFFEEQPTPAADRAALLAHHWRAAEDLEKALTYAREAAHRAKALYARPEAIAHYWHALDVLARLPDTPDRRRVHIETLLALVELPGWRRNEGEGVAGLEHLTRALEAARSLDDQALLVKVESLHGWYRQDEPTMLRAIERARPLGDDESRAFTALQYGGYLGQVGRYEASMAQIGPAIEMLGRMGQQYTQGYEMASSGRCYAARAGQLSVSLEYAARARALGDALDNPRLKAWRAMESEPFMYKGLWQEAVLAAEEGLPLCWQIREWFPIFWVSGWAALCYVKLGRPEAARPWLDRARPECEVQGAAEWGMMWIEMGLAHVSLATGHTAPALQAARRAVALADQSHFRLEQGAAWRALGQACEAAGDAAGADAAFRRSAEVLETIQSRPELAQTLLASGRFQARSDAAAGRALIERALRLFEEIEATGWIEEARAARAEIVAR